jgi:hypothetical protein
MSKCCFCLKPVEYEGELCLECYLGLIEYYYWKYEKQENQNVSKS